MAMTIFALGAPIGAVDRHLLRPVLRLARYLDPRVALDLPLLRERAAANSMARGNPSRREQMRATEEAFFSVRENEGVYVLTRSTNNCTDSHFAISTSEGKCFVSGKRREGTR